MRRLTSLTLAFTITLLATIALHAVTSAQTGGRPGAAPRPSPTPEPCVFTATHTAAPSEPELGEEVTITLHVRAACRSEPVPLHVVMVIDPSAEMGTRLMRDVQDSATRLVDDLDLKNNPSTKIAVVEVAPESRRPQGGAPEGARTLVQLTNSAPRVKNGVKRVQALGRTQADLGLEAALQVLLRARAGVPPYINEVVVLFSDGDNTADGNDAMGCNDILRAARQLRSQGVILITVCVGDDCDAECLRTAASSPRYFFRLEDTLLRPTGFQRVRKDVYNITLRRAAIIDLLPAGAAFVPGSDDPPARVLAVPEGTQVSWMQNFVPAEGITVAYRARPEAAGQQPISLGATAELDDNAGRHYSIRFPIPAVDVRPAGDRRPR